MRILIYMTKTRVDEDCIHLCIDKAACSKRSLAHVLWLSGKVPPAPLCSGLGMCARCRIRFISTAPECVEKEKELLSEEELSAGWRLACRHTIDSLEKNIEVFLPEGRGLSIEARKMSDDATSEAACVLAVDLGTTSLCWQAVSCDAATVRVVAEGQCLNPQMGTGADVVSRLALALDAEDAARLATLVHDALREIVKELPPIKEICLAANTAMTSIFLGKDIHSLAAAPYALPTAGHNVEHIEGLPACYIPPQLAPFVGGDVSAGMWALLEQKPSFPFLLADLGTNGEFVLALDAHKAFVTSVPLGPAIEGIGLRFGAMAHGSGVVHTVRLAPQGLTPHTFDDAPPRALCGTGYISLIHCLLRAGVLQENGSFYKDDDGQSPLSPLGKKLLRALHDCPDGRRFMLWSAQSDIFLSPRDIEEVLKVKAAFSLAIEELLYAAHMSHADVAHMYLAGAMGSHVNIADLEGLGFVPAGMGARIKCVGNSALAGARALACSKDARRMLHAWSQGCTLVQLAEDTLFEQKFLTHMTFSYTG